MNLNNLVLCCGMIRSASTLQYQVVADLIERNGLGQRIGFADRESLSEIVQRFERVEGFAIVKAHEILPLVDALIAQGRIRLFYTFRDLRAVALSVMRKWEIPFAQVIGRNAWLDTAVQSSNHWLSVPGVCVSRYEDMVLRLPTEVTKWADALGLNLTSTQADELAAKYSIEAQRERVRQARNPKSTQMSESNDFFDPNSLLHHNHILDGSLDGWKSGLEKWQIRQIEGRFSSWLLDHGYQLSTSAPVLS